MPIPLRADFDAARLRAAARGSKDAGQARRLLALAAVYEGATRTEAARIGGVTLQIVRDWVLKLLLAASIPCTLIVVVATALFSHWQENPWAGRDPRCDRRRRCDHR